MSTSLAWALNQSARIHSIRSNPPRRCTSTPAGSASAPVQLAHDPQARADLSAPGHFLAPGVLESHRSQPARAGQVTAVAAHDHARRAHPGGRLERLSCRLQGCRPQPSSRSRMCCAQATCSSNSCSRRIPGAAAGPRSHPPARAGNSAAARSAGRSAPRHCRRSCRRSNPRPCGPTTKHRLHAHKRHAPIRRQLAHHPPAVTGRLAPDHHPATATLCRSLLRPIQGGAQAPRLTPERTPGQHPRAMIVTTTICLRSAKSIPHDRVRRRHRRPQPRQSSVPVAIPPDTPLPLSMNVLLLRWDTKPDKRIRRLTRPQRPRQAEPPVALSARICRPRRNPGFVPGDAFRRRTRASEAVAIRG